MKQALVLAGGGAKGAYQAGCIKALKELGFNFDIVTGTSIGALNGLLVVQEDYEALYNLWDNLTINDVLKNPVVFDFSIESMLSQTNLIKPFFKSFINEKGADITPLKNILYSLYNHDKAINSKIDYGLVTVKYPKLTPIEITKQEMAPIPLVEYAIASASCFPAFPVHQINGQGYIDGGYYDGLPISLALKMGAKNIIAIELNQKACHDHFLNRPNITIIRPSYDLGTFLDFNRSILNWRIQLGYYDTLKTFKKIIGYQYSFQPTTLNQDWLNQLYLSILKYEDEYSRSMVNNALTKSNTPLTDLLKQNTYLNKLELEDYFIRSLEITMNYYNYQSDLLYDINTVIQEIANTFNQEYLQKKDLSNNNIITKIKQLTNNEAIFNFFHSFKNNKVIETSIIENLFLEEYIIALFINVII